MMVEIEVNCEFYGENKESLSGTYGIIYKKKPKVELWAMYLDIVYVQQ